MPRKEKVTTTITITKGNFFLWINLRSASEIESTWLFRASSVNKGANLTFTGFLPNYHKVLEVFKMCPLTFQVKC